MIALIAILAIRQPQTVSFTCRAEPLSRLVKDMGKATGLNLSVDPQCCADVMVVSASKVQRHELMAEIARVDSAKWQRRGRLYVLVPDTEARLAEPALERARAWAHVQAVLRADKSRQVPMYEQVRDTPLFPYLSKGSQTLREKLEPLMWAVRDDVLASVSPKGLNVPLESHVVYSTQPNGLQKELPVAALARVQRFVREYNERIPSADPADTLPARHTTQDLLAFLDRHGEFAYPRIPPVAKADLVLDCYNNPGELSANLLLFDSGGRAVFQTGGELGNWGNGHEWDRDREFIPKPIPLGGMSKLLLALMAQPNRAQGRGPTISPSLVAFLSDPVNHEPLSLVPTDVLLAYARANGKPLVALVPDEVFPRPWSLQSWDKSLERLLRDLSEEQTMVRRPNKRWIEVVPAWPRCARASRADRRQLGAFMRSVLSRGYAGREQLAWLSELQHDYDPGVVGGYPETIASAYFLGDAFYADNTMLRLWHVASPSERHAMLSGRRIAFGELSRSQQAVLESAIYGPWTPIERDVPDPRVGGPPKLPDGVKSYMIPGGREERLYGPIFEQTELFPTGDLSNAYLQVQVSHDPVFLAAPTHRDLRSLPELVDLDEAASDREVIPGFENPPRYVGRYRLGTATVYHVRLQIDQHFHLQSNLVDNVFGQQAPFVDMAHLPASVKRQIEARIMWFAAQRKRGQAEWEAN